jgi:pimeloyl-ACP methyl ester carboxylesterase
MGAASTLHIAVHRPEIVKGLILVRPAWIVASAPANNGPNREVGRLLADLSQEDARKRFEASETARLLAEVAPDNLASLRTFFSREPQATTAALLQSIASDGPGVSEQPLPRPDDRRPRPHRNRQGDAARGRGRRLKPIEKGEKTMAVD